MEPDQIEMMNEDELRDGLRKLIARPSSCTVDSIVRNMWNHFADGYNQWDSLGQDEKDTLFKIAVANAELTVTNEAQRNEDTVEPIVRLSSGFTQIEMDPLDRDAAVRDAHFRELSPHEWTWTPWQQARMALYVLWASQRLAAIRSLAEGRVLTHEPLPKAERGTT